jgi:hypothetical protein
MATKRGNIKKEKGIIEEEAEEGDSNPNIRLRRQEALRVTVARKILLLDKAEVKPPLLNIISETLWAPPQPINPLLQPIIKSNSNAKLTSG